jgi:uncharacterized protein YdaU (DUF1376 family)
MAETPLGWYKWYPRDFLASATVRKMSYTSQGIYRALLDLQWETGVPLSYLEACLVLRLSETEQEEFQPFFNACFPEGINAKLMEQRGKQAEAIKAQSEAGKRGGKLAGKGRSKVAKRKVRGTSNQTETETETEIVDKSTIENGVPNIFKTPRGMESWREFVAFRREIKKPLTTQATKLIVSKLQDFPEEEMIAALETAIEKRWVTVYPKSLPKTELTVTDATSPHGPGWGVHWGFDPEGNKEAYDSEGERLLAEMAA